MTAQGARDQLYEIIRKECSFEQKAREALDLGQRYLDADNGHLTRIDRETDHWEVLVSTDPDDGRFKPGLELDLGTTYCRHVIDDNEQIALHDAPNQGWAEDPAFQTHGVHCYIGTPLNVDGEPFGTVCFVSEDPREQFSDDELMFAELIAKLLERELEREQIESELLRQTNLAIVLNRILRHNLRNDLAVIRGFTQMMVEELDDPSYGETAIENIDDLIELAEKARHLDRSVATDYERQRLSIPNLVEDIVRSVSLAYPDATYSVEYEEPVKAAVQPNFEQSLTELIENAAKHGGKAPTVTVSVELVPNGFQVRISDDGPGLADHEVDVLQTGSETPLTHGSGLGLWLAHWIVSSHDGSIEASITDEGTTMTVSVPRTPTSGVQQQLSKLRRAHDQYQAAFVEANDAMIILNDDARIIDANPEASTIYGMEETTLLGQPLTRFFPADFDFESAWQEFKVGEQARDTVTIIGADGVERQVEYSATTDVVPGQHLVVSRDVTKQRERQQELRRTKQRLDLALEGTDTGVWDWNMETDEIIWDETMERLFGLEPGTFEGTFDAFVERIHPDDRGMVENAIEGAIEQGKRYEAEYRVQRDDGKDIWGLARGEMVSDAASKRMVGIVTDITEHKDRERELETLKNRYEALLDAAPDPIFVADAENGKITQVNQAAETLLGEPQEDIIGRHQSDLHPSDQSEQYRQLFEEQVESGGARRELPDGSPILLKTKDGKQIPVEINASSVSLPNRTVIFGIFRDISRRVEREAELKTLKRAMDKAPVGITLTDPGKDDNPIVYTNEQFRALTGYVEEGIIGRNCRFLQGEETDPETVTGLREAIEAQEPVTVVIRNYRKDGTKFWNRLTVAPIADESGELIRYVGFQEDVTDLLDGREYLKETN
ncbi:MAG: PAS domain S-box protein [Halodesulfurarchaeum sp.]|nr:PAS domain S-box protein [Halodesulfurarchaeum sp.]